MTVRVRHVPPFNPKDRRAYRQLRACPGCGPAWFADALSGPARPTARPEERINIHDLASPPDALSCRMARWVSARGQRAGGYGMILIERRVDDGGTRHIVLLGRPGPLMVSGP